MDSISLDSKKQKFQKLIAEFPWLGDFVAEFQNSDLQSNEVSPLMGKLESVLGDSLQIPSSSVPEARLRDF